MCTLKCISAQKSGTILGNTFFPIFLNIFLILLKNIFGKIRENWKNMGKLGKCWEKIGKKWENVFHKIVPDKEGGQSFAALGNGSLHVFYFIRSFKIALWAIYHAS